MEHQPAGSEHCHILIHAHNYAWVFWHFDSDFWFYTDIFSALTCLFALLAFQLTHRLWKMTGVSRWVGFVCVCIETSCLYFCWTFYVTSRALCNAYKRVAISSWPITTQWAGLRQGIKEPKEPFQADRKTCLDKESFDQSNLVYCWKETLLSLGKAVTGSFKHWRAATKKTCLISLK